MIYIEYKSGYGDFGLVWIICVYVFKLGCIVYFNGRVFKCFGGCGILGNYFCLEIGDEFWVFGVKVGGGDWYWVGSGLVLVDEWVLKDYFVFCCLLVLDLVVYYVVFDIKDIDVLRFYDLEN